MKGSYNLYQVTHADLVGILQYVGCHGIFGVTFDEEVYNNIVTDKHGDSVLDKCADILLSGGRINIIDYESDEKHDSYGDIPVTTIVDEEYHTGKYYVYHPNLKDFMRAMESERCESIVSNILHNCVDIEDIQQLTQYILFGRLVFE